MISVARRMSDRRRSGFTLLEMVVVLALAALIVGGALAKLHFGRDEAKLSEAMQTIEAMAKRARTVATLQQRAYALEFTYGRVSMMPYAEAVMEPSERESFMAEREFMRDEGDEGEASGLPTVTESWEADEDMLLLVKRWATNDWLPLTRNSRQVWRFDPNGICEPVGVRLEVEGGSWIAVVFHPLTASVADTEAEIQ